MWSSCIVCSPGSSNMPFSSSSRFLTHHASRHAHVLLLMHTILRSSLDFSVGRGVCSIVVLLIPIPPWGDENKRWPLMSRKTKLMRTWRQKLRRREEMNASPLPEATNGQQRPFSSHQKHHPTKHDSIAVISMFICLMVMLTIVLFGAFTDAHIGSISWLIILATAWLPGIVILILFSFSEWNDPGEKRDQTSIDRWNSCRKCWKMKILKWKQNKCSYRPTRRLPTIIEQDPGSLNSLFLNRTDRFLYWKYPCSDRSK